MKANELRLGNWIEIDNVHQQVLEVCGNLDCINGNINGSDIYSSLRTTKIPHPTSPLWTSTANPIQLSEEWLIRAGFDDTSMSYGKSGERFSLSGFAIRISLNNGCVFDDVYNLDIIRIVSVHQLQNLYFALTGEELTFKDL